ncbi:MAG: glycoside hydrolase family 78 protein [Muribaculaceae bacterium]|nr:glycoside hydrolase family 78 protein [Muribaculaceae bacterium]
MHLLRLILAPMATLTALAAMAGFPGDARWIGAPADELPLYPQRLSVFAIESDISIGPRDTVSILYGRHDPRLADPAFHLSGQVADPDAAHVTVTLTGSGSLTVSRTGYLESEGDGKILKEWQVAVDTAGTNHLSLHSRSGHTDIAFNGRHIGHVRVRPKYRGGDDTALPVVGDMAVALAGSPIVESLTVNNYRAPGAPLFALSEPLTASADIPLPVRPMPMLRARFALPVGKEIASATLTATARGIYTADINGLPVAPDYFLPGSTQYDRTQLYHTIDVTPLLRPGADNEIEVQLAEGWWSGPATYVEENWNFFGDRQSFIGSLDIDFTDGTKFSLPTNTRDWEVSTDGPLLGGSFFLGEVADPQRRAIQTWRPASEVDAPGYDPEFVPSFGDRVLPFDTLTAVSVSEPRPGVYIYDMGVNLAGVPLVGFGQLSEGQEVSLRFAEVLYPDMERYAPNAGMLMTENLRAAESHDIYRAQGLTGGERFSPKSTFHGFRYIELTGVDRPLPTDSVRAIRLSSIHRFNAGFSCSDTLVNQLWDNILRSSLSNFISIPTDCPQRNERLGWMGDISVFAPTATRLADVSPLLRQYLRSVRDCQTPDGRFPDIAPTGFGFGGFLWGSAGITVPLALFDAYGDTATLAEHYPAMRKYIDYIFSDYIDPVTDVIIQHREWGDLGDWLSPDYDADDKSLLWECYLIHDLDLMSRAADLLGHDDDTRRYASLAERRRKHFAITYVNPLTERTRHSAFDPARRGQYVDTQASYAIPLALGVYDSPQFRENFVSTVTTPRPAPDGTERPPYALSTGFVATAWISDALSLIGRDDLAYKQLTNREYPGWLYPVTQGATTIWERLDSYTHTDGFGSNNGMNSFNHYSFGSVGRWLITRTLGIDRNFDGSYTIAPRPDPTGSITHASGWLDTPGGRIESAWERMPDGSFSYEISAPAAVQALILLPGQTEPKPLINGTYSE